MTPTWQTADGRAQLHHGEALAVLRELPSDTFDALITDPPYSSGGLFKSDRSASTTDKYVQGGQRLARADFSGDNRDARSWRYWCQLWLSECCRLVKPSGYALVFTDWRQLPTATDALQAAGFVWRGIIAWDKGPGARAPHKGYCRHQCEYVIWGTRGPAPKATHAGPFPGCHHVSVRQSDKHHITGKPTELMARLVEIVPPGGAILDPFAGSGTTAVAAIAAGRSCTAIEQDAHYFDIARRRLTATL
jgi:site-specific DNA-methyltransferase (adenine-specific)